MGVVTADEADYADCADGGGYSAVEIGEMPTFGKLASLGFTDLLWEIVNGQSMKFASIGLAGAV